jgi:transglutaminase-like putative cysteine protease
VAGGSARWLDRGLIAASLLILTAGYRVVVEGSDWWITTILVTLVAVLTCAVLRGLGVRLVAPIAAVVLFITVAWVFVPGTLAAGFPTPASVGALSDLVGDARQVIVEEQAPVAAARGIVLLLAVAFGALVVVADALLELRRAAAWIGLLLLGVFAVPAMVSGRTPGFWLFVVAAVPWLVLLRSTTTSTSVPSRHRLSMQAPAVVLAVAALGCALALPTVAPDIRAAASAWGKPPPSVFGRGINPILELGQNLRRQSTNVALTYTTTADDPLYLKVATLRDFTGRTWRPGASLPGDRFEGNLGLREGIETKLDTTRITIEGLDSPMLPVPYVTQETEGLEGAWRYERMGTTVRSDSADTRGQTYTVSSLTITPTAEQMRQLTTVIGPSLSPFISLPADVPDTIVDTARDVTAAEPTEYDKALALQDFLRNGDFRYSETAPVADDYDGNGLSVVAEFLKRKAGYCVHFASAMAVMARTIDIPSRIAVGYAPGRITGAKDGETEYANTSDDLHAWTELFFEGAGWVRFDPTTTIGSATRFEEPDTGAPEESTDESTGQTSARDRNQGTDTTDDSASSSGTAPRTFVVTGAVVLLLMAAPGVLRELRRRHRSRSRSPEQLWHEVEDVAIDLGLDVPGTDTPRGFAARLGERPGVDPDALERLLHQVELARFARASGPPDPDVVRDAMSLTSALRAGSPRPDRWRARLLPRSLGPRPAAPRQVDADELVPV